jgi:hypothetical protein
MGLTIKANFTAEDLRKRGMIRPEVLKAELLTAETEIIRRTQAQQGIEGGGLPRLSPGYAKYKEEKGRNPVPDRTLSSKLLKAIHSKITSQQLDRIEGRVYFQEGQYPGKKAPSISQVAGWMQKLAPFFGLSRIQRQQLIDAVRKNLGK